MHLRGHCAAGFNDANFFSEFAVGLKHQHAPYGNALFLKFPKPGAGQTFLYDFFR